MPIYFIFTELNFFLMILVRLLTVILKNILGVKKLNIMNMKYKIITFFIVFATFISAFIILIRTVNVFKSPSEIKYKIEYIDIEKSKIWMMENQQKDYDKKTHD